MRLPENFPNHGRIPFSFELKMARMEVSESGHSPEVANLGSEPGRDVVTCGLIGASGFIGLRTTEILSANPSWKVIPIVRAASSLAVLARQDLDWCISEFLSPSRLALALEGCSVCIHSAIGDASQIVEMAKATYRACALAGVSRLVWLSTAAVHGQNPPLGTHEETPLHDRHPIAYNNAKVRAEWALERLAQDGAVEVVRIRPSIVFGPRSRWISDAGDNLRGGNAAWINRGQGICNTLYIDNLVEFVSLAAIHPKAPGQAFLVGDGHVVTWREFFLPIADFFGLDASVWRDAPAPPVVAERESKLAMLIRSPAYSAIRSRIPDIAKRLGRGLINNWNMPKEAESPWNVRKPKALELNLELALLQQCRWCLSNEKAQKRLGFSPPISFSEGMKESLAWLRFLQ